VERRPLVLRVLRCPARSIRSRRSAQASHILATSATRRRCTSVAANPSSCRHSSAFCRNSSASFITCSCAVFAHAPSIESIRQVSLRPKVFASGTRSGGSRRKQDNMLFDRANHQKAPKPNPVRVFNPTQRSSTAQAVFSGRDRVGSALPKSRLPCASAGAAIGRVLARWLGRAHGPRCFHIPRSGHARSRNSSGKRAWRHPLETSGCAEIKTGCHSAGKKDRLFPCGYRG